MARRLPTTLQIKKLGDRFCKNNPDACDLIDFRAVIDKSLTMPENLEILREEYPQYSWNGPRREDPIRTYEKQVIRDLKQQAGEYSYDVLKKYRIKDYERKAKKLETCEAARKAPRVTPPGTCARKTVPVVAHRRCPPRRG